MIGIPANVSLAVLLQFEQRPRVIRASGRLRIPDGLAVKVGQRQMFSQVSLQQTARLVFGL